MRYWRNRKQADVDLARVIMSYEQYWVLVEYFVNRACNSNLMEIFHVMYFLKFTYGVVFNAI